MAIAAVGEVELYYDSFGEESDPAVLLVSGLGSQCINFTDEFLKRFVGLGLRVIRFDNRDVGLSTHLDHLGPGDVVSAFAAAVAGEAVDSPYTFSDMAADAVALLDHLEIESAHIFGTSMGGMISQTIAIEHPERIRTLTSAYSTTGEPGYGMPQPDCLAALMSNMVPKDTREDKIQSSVDLANLIGTTGAWEAAEVQRRCEQLVDRAHNPDGVARQAVAMFASGSRSVGLKSLKVPTLVLHGDRDPLVAPNGGERTAELVPNAKLRIIEGMAHDLPPSYWDVVLREFEELL